MNCKVCDITNLTEVNIFTEKEIDDFINGIVSGTIQIERLDTTQYLKIARKLSESIVIGFGDPLFEDPIDMERFNLYNSFIDNVYAFSAAKQYQLVREIISLTDSNSKIKTKDEFYIEAKKLFTKYNVTYLTTELDSAEWQARSAKDWLEFVKWNNVEN